MVYGKAESADLEAATAYFLKILQEKIAVGGCTAKQALNMDEIGLF